MKEPLNQKELQEMAGKPVYCPELKAYGIIKCETKGRWAGMPVLVGVWHQYGAAVNFEYNILERGLKCYEVNRKAKKIPKSTVKENGGAK